MGRLSNRRGTVGTGSVLALQLAPRHYFYDRCNEILAEASSIPSFLRMRGLQSDA
jgi:hypothetical protein